MIFKEASKNRCCQNEGYDFLFLFIVFIMIVTSFRDSRCSSHDSHPDDDVVVTLASHMIYTIMTMMSLQDDDDLTAHSQRRSFF